MVDRPAGADDPGEPIAFVDLKAQARRLGPRIQEAIGRVLEHGRFVLGPEVFSLEDRLAELAGARHAITCSSGTDALLMALMAWEAGPGCAVFVPNFTFAATAEVVVLLGATPVFVDVLPDTFNMDPTSLRGAIVTAEEAGLRPHVVIPVDLFGQPADYDALLPLSREHGLLVLADAAQSLGASWRGRPVGSLADVTATSFFPAKPLGCYGDGGALFTDDDGVAEALRSIRVHGQGSDKYDNVRVGINGRLDTLQAAVLLEKLEVFESELALRAEAADRYSAALDEVAAVPRLRPEATSAWAQYTVLVDDRDGVAQRLAAGGVPTAVYYPRTLDRQPPYKHFPTAPGDSVAAELAERVLSLPMHPYLSAPVQERICASFRRALAR